MENIKMKISGERINHTTDNSREYLKVQFKGEFDGKPLTASINLDDSDEIIERVANEIENETMLNIEFDKDEIKTGTYKDKPYRAVEVANKKDVKEALGIKPRSIAEAVKSQRKLG